MPPVLNGRTRSRFLVLGLLLLFPAAFLFGVETARPTVEARLAELEVRVGSAAGVNNGDNAWLLVSSALVLVMSTPGLILFYGGLVRGKNVLGTIMHSLVLMGLVSVLRVVSGCSIAFGR